jgi:hypothetical protein
MTAMRPRNLLVALLCAIALGLAACGGSDAESSTSTTASQPNVSRYCELVGELDRASTEVFNQLDSTSPSKEDLVAAQLQILNQNADLISQIETVVPDEIKDDFQLSEQSARQRAEAGDPSAPPPDVVQANLRLRQFRTDNCPKSTLQPG